MRKDAIRANSMRNKGVSSANAIDLSGQVRTSQLDQAVPNVADSVADDDQALFQRDS
jgi:hypothetical protein